MKQDFPAKLIDTLRTEYGLLSPTLDESKEELSNDTFIIFDGSKKYVAKLCGEDLRAQTISQFQ